MADDFNKLFDNFISRKKKKRHSFLDDSIEDLPFWKEIRNNRKYAHCFICQEKFVSEDIVEQCPHCFTYFHFHHYREWMHKEYECIICRNRRKLKELLNKGDYIAFYSEVETRFTKLQFVLETNSEISLKQLIDILDFQKEVDLEKWLLQLDIEGYLIIQDQFEVFSQSDIVRSMNTLIESLKVSKDGSCTCLYCGALVETSSISKCPECQKNLPRCEICKRTLVFGDTIGKCPYCKSLYHLRHLRETVKITAKCPLCRHIMTLEEIIDINSQTKGKHK